MALHAVFSIQWDAYHLYSLFCHEGQPCLMDAHDH